MYYFIKLTLPMNLYQYDLLLSIVYAVDNVILMLSASHVIHNGHSQGSQHLTTKTT